MERWELYTYQIGVSHLALFVSTWFIGSLFLFSIIIYFVLLLLQSLQK
jgi:hypothetical protein